MTVFPGALDTDTEINPIDDGSSEYAVEVINQLRSAVFSIEQTLGINVQGSAGDLSTRLDVSLNPDGTIKGSALIALGLLTNIVDAQVSPAAGIKESKLTLDFSTSVLKNMIDVLNTTLTVLDNYVVNVLTPDIILHLGGASSWSLSPYAPRHVASHLDLNNQHTDAYAHGIDPRDPANFFNYGLTTKSGGFRTAFTVMQALLQINDDLVDHETRTATAHVASAISLFTNNFVTIPTNINNVQLAIEYIDTMATTIYEEHRASMHSNGITNISNSEDLIVDGYVQFLSGPIGAITVLNTTINDVIEITTASGLTQFQLDNLFRTISVGDYINVDYGGYLIQHIINSIRHYPTSKWMIKIDGINSINKTYADPAYVTFEKKKVDDNTGGSLAVCNANQNLWAAYPSVPGGLIIVDPRCASAIGLDVNLEELDTTHYNLHIAFYPNSTPTNIVTLPPIDITGDAGVSTGTYSLKRIIENTNSAFRAAGYNFRMVAFEKDGQFCLSIADTYGNPGFSIISGQINGSGVLIPGSFANNVIGNDRLSSGDYNDALGLGQYKANVASPFYAAPTGVPGSVPTKIFVGRKNKNYNVNGHYYDFIAKDTTTNIDGYWSASIISRTVTAGSIEVTYQTSSDLSTSRIRAGSTIVIQPTISTTDPLYLVQDYGRFIVKEVVCTGCPVVSSTITVINGIYSTGNPLDSSSAGPLAVKVYFCDDSVTFDAQNIVDDIPIVNVKRHFEVFADKSGATQAYERARFAIASGVGLIDTSYGTTTTGKNYGWHIMKVSPKLQGYVEVGGPYDTRKYITFNVFGYNATEQTYSGYIQQTDPTTLTPYIGQIVRGKKGQTIRYYDSTGVDYIDILFDEPNTDNTALSVTIASLKIEIFKAEDTNQEFMALAGCEQIVCAGSGTLITHISDFREFGTVNEKVLSTSAISFIESGDKHLHENGIINGFNYVKPGTSNTLFYNGGIALVEGKIVNKNNFVIKPHPIVYSSEAISTVEVAVCVTKVGTIQFLLLNSVDGIVQTRITNVLNKYEKAYTFAEIVETRKDLVPISILSITSELVGASVSLVSINGKTDIRRFLTSGTINDIFVVSTALTGTGSYAPSNKLGHFDNFITALNYITYLGTNKSKIIIKGTIKLDHEGFYLPDGAILEGLPGNKITYTDLNLLKLNNNVTIKGINFERNTDIGEGIGPTANPYSPTGLGKGTLYLSLANGAVQYQNITIEDCTFVSVGERSSSVPYILFEQIGDGAIFKDIIIRNNKFNDVLAQLDVAFVNRDGALLASTPTAAGTLLDNVLIENNVGNFGSYMMFSSDIGTGVGERISRGISTYGVKIQNNHIDYIWLNVSRFVMHGFNGTTNTTYMTSLPPLHPELLIFGNTFTGISCRTIAGRNIINPIFGSVTPGKVASPSTTISGNKCTHIEHLVCADTYRNLNNANYAGELIISDNIISSSKYSAELFSPSDDPKCASSQFYAIDVGTNMTGMSVVQTNVNIHDNIISNPFYNILGLTNLYDYLIGIKTQVQSKIHNNKITNCFSGTGGVGILCDLNIYSGVSNNYLTSAINDNWIERGATSIAAYIQISGTTKIKEVQITDNFFDAYYVSGSGATANFNVIKYTTGASSPASRITAVRNINQLYHKDMLPDILSGWPAQPIDSAVVGWKHECEVYGAGPSSLYTLTSKIVTTIDQPQITNATYNLTPLVINLCLDGAKPFRIIFKIKALASGGNIKISAAMPESETVFNTAVLATADVTEFDVYDAVGGLSTFPADASIHTFVIDIYKAWDRFNQIDAASRNMPLYLSFTNGGTYYPLIKTNSTTYEQITITEARAYYIY